MKVIDDFVDGRRYLKEERMVDKRGETVKWELVK